MVHILRNCGWEEDSLDDYSVTWGGGGGVYQKGYNITPGGRGILGTPKVTT